MYNLEYSELKDIENALSCLMGERERYYQPCHQRLRYLREKVADIATEISLEEVELE